MVQLLWLPCQFLEWCGLDLYLHVSEMIFLILLLPVVLTIVTPLPLCLYQVLLA